MLSGSSGTQRKSTSTDLSGAVGRETARQKEKEGKREIAREREKRGIERGRERERERKRGMKKERRREGGRESGREGETQRKDDEGRKGMSGCSSLMQRKSNSSGLWGAIERKGRGGG
jgi:hypothetical protein